METYSGIVRKDFPDWLGWVILDLLASKPEETEEHRDEIQVQLYYEVKAFYHNKKVA